MTEDNSKTLTVSVVIPAYNADKYICRAIESVLGQSSRADEIIVVDDGSSDNTKELVEGYQSSVRYIYQENAGASAARNRGIEAAQCEWIAFLDADDEWLGEYLQKQRELLERNPELVWTTANFYTCLCNENRRGAVVEPAKAKKLLGGKCYFENYFGAFLEDASGWTGTMLIKRKVFEKAEMFRVGQKRGEDMDMWFRIAYLWPRVGYIPEPMAVYHLDIVGSAMQGLEGSEEFDFCEFIGRHLSLAAELNRLDEFRPCAVLMARRIIRSLFFEGRSEEIKRIKKEFSNLLPVWYKGVIGLFTTFPKSTTWGCHMISRVVRLLHLRRQVVRRPKK